MRAPKILATFSSVVLLLGLSCALNPQPEPPLEPRGPIGGAASGSPTGSGLEPGVDKTADGGVAVTVPQDPAEAGSERQDSSTTSDVYVLGDGGAGGASEAGDSMAESSSEADAGADREAGGDREAHDEGPTEEGATTAD